MENLLIGFMFTFIEYRDLIICYGLFRYLPVLRAAVWLMAMIIPW